MYQQDWILRQIEILGVAFRRIMAEIIEHRPDSALELAEEAMGEVMGSDPSLVHSLSPDGLLMLLSTGGEADEFRVRALGEILYARAEALDEAGRTDEAESDRARARVLLHSALETAEDDDAARIKEVLGWLDQDGSSRTRPSGS